MPNATTIETPTVAELCALVLYLNDQVEQLRRVSL